MDIMCAYRKSAGVWLGPEIHLSGNAVFRTQCGSPHFDTADSGYAEVVPYELSFTAAVTVIDGRSRYINDCCWGGDVIRDRLMPVVAERYQEIRTAQEDWGWFIWFRDGAIRLAVDIFCDDIPSGAFRVRLTSRRKKLIGSEILDTPELERLRDLVVSAMVAWAESLQTERVED